jgi:hypothetical protein
LIEQPSIRTLEAKVPEVALREVTRHFGLKENEITGKRTGYSDQRAVALELIYRPGRMSQGEGGKPLAGESAGEPKSREGFGGN